MRKVVFYRARMIFLLVVLVACIGLSLKLILQGFLSENCSVNDVFGAAIATIFILLFVCVMPVIYRFFRNGFSKKPAIMSIAKDEGTQVEYNFKHKSSEGSIILGEDGLPENAFF
jgi:hypothetical protein